MIYIEIGDVSYVLSQPPVSVQLARYGLVSLIKAGKDQDWMDDEEDIAFELDIVDWNFTFRWWDPNAIIDNAIWY